MLFATAAWATGVVIYAARRKHRVYLETLPSAPPPDGWPSVAIVFAGRNEEAGIEPALKSLLAIDYPRLTIHAVDDRSTDRTGEIMDRIARDDSRLRVTHVEELPPGWLGKNHALHQATRGLDADFVLFTDADVVFARDALKKAVAFASTRKVDMTVVFPELSTSSVFERAICVVFAIVLSLRYQNWMIEHPKLRVYLGIGAFNLLRREALERIGGFDRMKLSIDDDVRLGEAVKVHGFTLKVVYGVHEIRVKWQDSFWGYVKGFEKNGFAAAGFRVPEVVWNAFSCALIFVAPWLGLLSSDPATVRWSIVNLVTLGVLIQCGRRSTGAGFWYLPLMPFMGVALAFALLNSAYKTLKQGGVVWRDHKYPLPELKAHVKERTKWLDDAWKTTRRGQR